MKRVKFDVMNSVMYQQSYGYIFVKQYALIFGNRRFFLPDVIFKNWSGATIFY
jgi:hypothetical protein